MKLSGIYFNFRRQDKRLTTILKNHWTLEVANGYYQKLEEYLKRHDIDVIIVKTDKSFVYDDEILEVKEKYPELEMKHGVSQVFYLDKAKKMQRNLTTHYVNSEKEINQILSGNRTT